MLARAHPHIEGGWGLYEDLAQIVAIAQIVQPQSGHTGLPSVSGQRRRRNTFSTPLSDMRMILAALSERALAESRKCCAMRTDHERKTGTIHGSVSPRVQAQFRRWQQLHNTGFLTLP